MGILTNPNTDDQNRLVKFLQGKGGYLSLICYISGILWLVFLANAEYNLGKNFRLIPVGQFLKLLMMIEIEVTFITQDSFFGCLI